MQAVTLGINGDSSCGINVAHLEGRSREETATLRASKRGGRGRSRQSEREGRMLGLRPSSLSADSNLWTYHLATFDWMLKSFLSC